MVSFPLDLNAVCLHLSDDSVIEPSGGADRDQADETIPPRSFRMRVALQIYDRHSTDAQLWLISPSVTTSATASP